MEIMKGNDLYIERKALSKKEEIDFIKKRKLSYYDDVDDALKQKLQRDPTKKEIASKLGISKDKLDELYLFKSRIVMESLDAPVKDDGDLLAELILNEDPLIEDVF